MQPPEDLTRYFFVDESGDTTFFDSHGNCIIGQPGCSPYLMVGFVRTDSPAQVRTALSALASTLAQDPYFKGVPSFQSTIRAFHAKVDCPEVRREVFRLLPTLPLKGHFIFARKKEKTFRSSFGANTGAFYDHLVTLLFKTQLHLASRNHIVFAKRGPRERQAPLAGAVKNAVASFQETYAYAAATTVTIQCQSPVGEPCIQAADYFLWAIQRIFVRREDRFFALLKDQIEFVWDLYDTDRYPKNIYTSTNPLSVHKISPL